MLKANAPGAPAADSKAHFPPIVRGVRHGRSNEKRPVAGPLLHRDGLAAPRRARGGMRHRE